MPITIKDIAESLNLSVSTVSKALNGYSDVSEATRRLVREAQLELGYHPSAAARNLRLKQGNRIGIVLPFKGMRSDAILSMVEGIGKAAKELAVKVLFYTSIDDDMEMLEQICRSRDVNGLLISGQSQTFDLGQAVNFLRQEALPFVVFGHQFEGAAIATVAAHYHRGVSQAVNYLLDAGHQRIAYISRVGDDGNNQEKFGAYTQSLKQRGQTLCPELVVNAAYESFAGVKAMQQLLALDTPPDAVLCFNDHVAMDAIFHAQSVGFRIPQDIAVIGCDNITHGQLMQPKLSTIEVPLFDIGYAAMRHLFDLMGEGEHGQIVFETEFLRRESA